MQLQIAIVFSANIPPSSSEYFVIGSWDDHGDNGISLWRANGAQGEHDQRGGHGGQQEPTMVHKEKHQGDVNKIKVTGTDLCC